jgi:hypothetical protein
MTVSGRSAGTSSSTGLPSASVFSSPTFMSAKEGMYFETGSSSDSLPASISIVATLVIGLVMECSAKIVSGVIGSLVVTSRTPRHFR